MESALMPTNGRVDKTRYIYTMKLYSAITNESRHSEENKWNQRLSE